MLRNALGRQSIRQLQTRPLSSGLSRPPRLARGVVVSHGIQPALSWHVGGRGLATQAFQDDTIYALSSAQGRAGIAVIRVSGPACREVSPGLPSLYHTHSSRLHHSHPSQIYDSLCPSKAAPPPRYAGVRTLFEPGSTTDVLDADALVLRFPAPKTVTGEEVLELHVHGSPATVKAVLGAIPRCGGGGGSGSSIRYAEPGEFTRRAFLHDRLDLAQVESLSDTLAAETEQQRRAAVRGSSGRLGRTYEAWRRQLLLAQAEMEALIDFSEDQHFDESPAALLEGVTRHVRDMLASMAAHDEAGRRGELLRRGIRVALVGPPNAGKSSLMNLIVGREASIVSPEAGTTRDVVEASLDIRGYLCTFADTAGFRSTLTEVGAVEEEGIRRARQRALDADVVVVLASIEPRDGGGVVGGGGGGGGGYYVRYDPETLALAARAPQCVIAVNKIDAAVSNGDGDESLLEVLLQDLRQQIVAATALTEVPRTCSPSEAVPLFLLSCKEANEAEATTTSSTNKINRRDQTDPGGVRGLVSALAERFARLTFLPDDWQDLVAVTVRQRELLAQCRLHLGDYLVASASDDTCEPYGEPSAGAGGSEQRGTGSRHSGGGGPATNTGVGGRSRSSDGRESDHVVGGTEPALGRHEKEPDVVLAAEHLRLAAGCLARITGRGDAGDIEEVLGVIFEKYVGGLFFLSCDSQHIFCLTLHCDYLPFGGYF